jgi:hypothetical protein
MNMATEETGQVTKLARIDTYNDFAESNARALEDVINDRKISAADKLRAINLGVRTQVLLSRDAANRRAELLRLGMKPTPEAMGITFNPAAE